MNEESQHTIPFVEVDGHQVITMKFWWEMTCAQNRRIDCARSIALSAISVALAEAAAILAMLLLS